mmetsp:Transcript_15109/g.38853  ORF Transcript_15109/g.38853 Transcript_15109/m.38853 type:complete len:304 (-) Transcript_15109:3293-4204(-)
MYTHTGLPSGSAARTSKLASSPSHTPSTRLPSAVGGSGVLMMVTCTVPTSEPPAPSSAWTRKMSDPYRSRSPVYAKVPLGHISTLPALAGHAMLKTTSSPSGSEATICPTWVASSLMVKPLARCAMTGGSFTGTISTTRDAEPCMPEVSSTENQTVRFRRPPTSTRGPSFRSVNRRSRSWYTAMSASPDSVHTLEAALAVSPEPIVAGGSSTSPSPVGSIHTRACRSWGLSASTSRSPRSSDTVPPPSTQRAGASVVATAGGSGTSTKLTVAQGIGSDTVCSSTMVSAMVRGVPTSGASALLR